LKSDKRHPELDSGAVALEENPFTLQQDAESKV